MATIRKTLALMPTLMPAIRPREMDDLMAVESDAERAAELDRDVAAIQAELSEFELRSLLRDCGVAVAEVDPLLSWLPGERAGAGVTSEGRDFLAVGAKVHDRNCRSGTSTKTKSSADGR